MALGVQSQVLFETGFEADGGYEPGQTLAGQDGWLATREGGNGITEESLFPEPGAQAFVGFVPFDGLDEENYDLFVFRPINYIPEEADGPLVFEVDVMIANSANEKYDCFRWAFFNQNEDRLFSVDFDNNALQVFYALDSGGFVQTDEAFENELVYRLRVTLDFAANEWSFALDGKTLGSELPITTTGLDLNLSDASAVWVVSDEDPEDGAIEAGDNFMAFDNLSWRLEPTAREPFSIEIELISEEALGITVIGESNTDYLVQVSEDMEAWSDVSTGSAPDGVVETFDRITFSPRFYRAIIVE